MLCFCFDYCFSATDTCLPPLTPFRILKVVHFLNFCRHCYHTLQLLFVAFASQKKKTKKKRVLEVTFSCFTIAHFYPSRLEFYSMPFCTSHLSQRSEKSFSLIRVKSSPYGVTVKGFLWITILSASVRKKFSKCFSFSWNDQKKKCQNVNVFRQIFFFEIFIRSHVVQFDAPFS